jgi:ammonium transporter, Amt family
VVTFVIGIVLKKTIGLRVTEEVEVGGIDLAVHAESAYETLGAGSRVVTEVK